eukprot:SAG31_NODE_6827_length_1876_cov_2.367473_1_plen_227_part_00
MKTFSFTVLFVLGGACAALAAAVIPTAVTARASWIKQLGVSSASAEGAGESICIGAETGFLPFFGYGSDDVLTNTMNLAAVGSAAATVPDQADLSAPAAAAVSSAGDANSTGDGVGAHAVPPSEHGYHTIQTDFVDTTNLTGGAAAAAGSCGSPGSPHGDLYMCCGLQRGSGGEKIIGTPPILGLLGRALAQPFSFLGSLIRCDSARRTSGGGGVGAAPSPAPLPR